MSSIVLQGNLVNTPELLTSKNGQQYTRVSIACSSNFKKDDEWQETGSVYHNFTLFGRQAVNFCNAKLVKGTPLIVGGSYRVVDKPAYTGKDGVQHPEHSEMDIMVLYIGVEIKTNFVTSVFNKNAGQVSQPTVNTPYSSTVNSDKSNFAPKDTKSTQSSSDDLFGNVENPKLDNLFADDDDDIFA